MGVNIGALLAVLAVTALAIALPVALVYGLYKLFQGLIWLFGALFGAIGRVFGATFRGFGAAVGHCWGFGRATVADALRTIGGLVTALVMSVLATLNVVFGRWSRANHYGRAIEEEGRGGALALYRLVVGNPARFLGLGELTEGIERRLPEVMARAPRGDRPKALREFDGYRVQGELPRGGSGAWLFLAQPTDAKRAALASAGRLAGEQVVIKSFSLDDGSTLPQIVRESRALEAARDLGLVLEHELTDERFFYVMPYVEGPDLGEVTARLHRQGGAGGLDDVALRKALTYTAQLLETLHRFHAKGLWHKDIKPNNVIVSGERAHLVDLGLVTPLQSAMTLTTHGTEYFRDPEMVKLAMQGVKVHEVDGVKFDLYSAGAVLYSALENSFPAHGSLSRMTKRAPDAVHWIVRRAMADMVNRYRSADEMLGDLRAVLAASDAFALRPAELPSMGGGSAPGATPPIDLGEYPTAVSLPTAVTASMPAAKNAAVEAAARAKAKKRRKSQGVRYGVVVAALVLAVITTLPIAIALYSATGAPHIAHVHRYDIPSGPSLAVTPAPSPFAHRVPGEAERLWTPQQIDDLARRLEAQLGEQDADWRAWLTQANRAASRTEPLRILVLDDLAADLDRERLYELMHHLRFGDFELVGEDLAEHPGDLEHVASARVQAGFRDLADAESAERLQDFVTQTADVDLVLWVRSAGEPESVVYRIVASAGSPLNVGPARVDWDAVAPAPAPPAHEPVAQLASQEAALPAWLSEAYPPLEEPRPRRVLLLDDLAPDFDRSRLYELMNGLRLGHFELVGKSPAGADQLALARAEAGVADPLGADAAGRLRAYVEVSDAVDLVLWVCPSDEPGALVYRLVAPDGSPLEIPPTRVEWDDSRRN